MLELEITVGGQQRLMLLVVLWTDEQGAVSAAVPSWAFDQGPEFEIEAAVSGDAFAPRFDGESAVRGTACKVGTAGRAVLRGSEQLGRPAADRSAVHGRAGHHGGLCDRAAERLLDGG